MQNYSNKLQGIIDYQDELAKKIARNESHNNTFVQFHAIEKKFIVPIKMLHSLMLWRTPKKIYPTLPHILGLILSGQTISTVIALEKMHNLPFQYSLSKGGLNYQFILTLNACMPFISFAISNCQLVDTTIDKALQQNDIEINEAWLKKYIYEPFQ